MVFCLGTELRTCKQLLFRQEKFQKTHTLAFKESQGHTKLHSACACERERDRETERVGDGTRREVRLGRTETSRIHVTTHKERRKRKCNLTAKPGQRNQLLCPYHMFQEKRRGE